jgi:hypothetical protein
LTVAAAAASLDPMTALNRRLSVAPMMDWTDDL